MAGELVFCIIALGVKFYKLKLNFQIYLLTNLFHIFLCTIVNVLIKQNEMFRHISLSSISNC